MKHNALDGERSIMIYTYTFETRPQILRWLMEPIVKRMFDHQTRRRFARLKSYLVSHREEIGEWQRSMQECKRQA